MSNRKCKVATGTLEPSHQSDSNCQVVSGTWSLSYFDFDTAFKKIILIIQNILYNLRSIKNVSFASCNQKTHTIITHFKFYLFFSLNFTYFSKKYKKKIPKNINKYNYFFLIMSQNSGINNSWTSAWLVEVVAKSVGLVIKINSSTYARLINSQTQWLYS